MAMLAGGSLARRLACSKSRRCPNDEEQWKSRALGAASERTMQNCGTSDAPDEGYGQEWRMSDSKAPAKCRATRAPYFDAALQSRPRSSTDGKPSWISILTQNHVDGLERKACSMKPRILGKEAVDLGLAGAIRFMECRLDPGLDASIRPDRVIVRNHNRTCVQCQFSKAALEPILLSQDRIAACAAAACCDIRQHVHQATRPQPRLGEQGDLSQHRRILRRVRQLPLIRHAQWVRRKIADRRNWVATQQALETVRTADKGHAVNRYEDHTLARRNPRRFSAPITGNSPSALPTGISSNRCASVR